MEIFDSLSAMRARLPEGMCAAMANMLTNMQDYVVGSLEQDNLTDLFGAPVYLVERIEDLSAILLMAELDGRNLSLAEAASATFDIAEWVDNGEFAIFATIETADGGPQFIVPRHIAEQVRFVGESIDLVGLKSG